VGEQDAGETESPMQPLDYGRSFLIGTKSNEVRFWVESRTRILDNRTGRWEDYVQCASCKSEDTFGTGNLFYADNYDFLPIFGPEEGLIFRRKAYLNANYRGFRPASEMWGGMQYHLVEARCEELTDTEAILAATKAFRPLVAQTEIWDDATGLRAILEYPVKTMNTTTTAADYRRSEPSLYQVDTGPLAYPDLSRRDARAVEGIVLAYVAFNEPGCASFVLEVPTPLRENGAEGSELARVYHFSERLVRPARNRVFATD
jgi:hypothetical protein